MVKRSYPYPVATAADSVEYVLGVSAAHVMQFPATSVGTFDSVADAEAEALGSSTVIYVASYGGTDTDNGGAFYVKRAAEPSHIAKFQSADGSWWEISTLVLFSDMVGLYEDAANAGAAFTDFMEAAVALGVPALFDGTFDFTTAASVGDLPAGIRLSGVSKETSILRRVNDVNRPILRGTSVDGGRLSNFQCQYTAATTFGASPPDQPTDGQITTALAVEGDSTGLQAAILLDDCVDWHLTDIHAEGRFYYGCDYLQDCSTIRITDCTAKGFTNRSHYVIIEDNSATLGDIHYLRCGGDGIQPGFPSDRSTHNFNTNAAGTGIAKNITFVDCWAKNGADGFIAADRIEGQRYIGCRVDSCDAGFLPLAANGQDARRIVYSACTARDCDYGFYGISANFVTLDGCRATACSVAGVEMDGCDDFVISGFMAESNGGDGILLSNSSQRGSVIGCIATSNTGTGIKSAASTDRIAFVGNVARSNGTDYDALGTNHVTAPNI
jgi:hypothetical protein